MPAAASDDSHGGVAGDGEREFLSKCDSACVVGKVELVEAGVRNREISGLRARSEPDLDHGLAAWRRHKRTARAEAAVAGSKAQQQR